jgi:hypothetical protein
MSRAGLKTDYGSPGINATFSVQFAEELEQRKSIEIDKDKKYGFRV